jgi:hypothetical protein
MQQLNILHILWAIPLAGCATTSFAPPAVNIYQKTAIRQDNKARTTCTYTVSPEAGNPRKTLVVGGVPVPAGASGAQAITPDLEGARALIDNFVFAYRCRMGGAANGRQIFDVPAYLAATGAVVATAFGAGTDATLAAGAVGAILGGGKGYYAPKDKAAVYNGALGALLCIKTESVGIRAFNIEAAPKPKSDSESGGGGGETPKVTIPPEKQYFDMVTAALLSVERILADRLSNIGKYDPAGVVAEVTTLNDQIKAAEKARADKAETVKAANKMAEDATAAAEAAKLAAEKASKPVSPAEGGSGGKGKVNLSAARIANAERVRKEEIAKTAREAAAKTAKLAAEGETELILSQIQPELAKCVVQAKL